MFNEIAFLSTSPLMPSEKWCSLYYCLAVPLNTWSSRHIYISHWFLLLLFGFCLVFCLFLCRIITVLEDLILCSGNANSYVIATVYTVGGRKHSESQNCCSSLCICIWPSVTLHKRCVIYPPGALVILVHKNETTLRLSMYVSNNIRRCWK